MNKQRGFAFLPIILIVIILGALGVGGYVVMKEVRPNYQYPTKPAEKIILPTSTTPAPATIDETANWKTYRNKEYGFEFKYPADWSVQDTSITYPPFRGREERKSGGAVITSRYRHDIAGYENQEARFIVYLSFRNDEIVVSDIGFAKKYKPGDQAVQMLPISADDLSKFPEYKIYQQIVESARFTTH